MHRRWHIVMIYITGVCIVIESQNAKVIGHILITRRFTVIMPERRAVFILFIINIMQIIAVAESS